MSISQWFFTLPKEAFGTSFNSTAFNLSSSATATAFTGFNCLKTTTKAIFSPNPLCKGLYGAAAALNAVSCATSSISLLSSSSALAPFPLFFGTLGSISAIAGKVCNTFGDCASAGSSKFIDTCVDNCVDQIVNVF